MVSMDYDEDEAPMTNVAKGLFAIARAINQLGTADAATPMGAIECLALEVKNGFAEVATAIERAAEEK